MTRLGYIDGLRAVAVFGVMLTHAYVFSPSPWPEFNRLATLGRHGVELFFVISGFCLSYPFLKRAAAGRPPGFDAAAFFAKRTLRIIPPYYAALAGTLLLYMVTGMQCNACAPDTIVQQLLFFDRDRHFAIPQAWTLPIEVRWYLLFPAMLMLYLFSRRLFFAVGLTCYVLFYFTLIDAPDIVCLPAFMLGIYAADIEIRRLPVSRWAFAVSLAYVPVLVFLEPTSAQLDPIAAAVAFCLVAAATRPGMLRTVLSNPLLRFFGVCSYSIYLVHGPLMKWFQQSLQWAPALSAAVALAVSVGFWFAVERPITETRLKTTILARLTPAFRKPFEWIVAANG
jgi:peptidoglycan/LPS O-acetylase OafA/YrhL